MDAGVFLCSILMSYNAGRGVGTSRTYDSVVFCQSKQSLHIGRFDNISGAKVPCTGHGTNINEQEV